jgi:signal transduction histidine kinase
MRDPITRQQIQNVMLVPLLVRGATIGLLAIATDRDNLSFTSDQVRLAETIAGDVASAIENARLFEQAQVAAVSEERSRLARDLHDEVTQTIYSATLIAEALPQVWERNPAEGQRNLVKLRQLVRGALAEMRTLLFELRPTALEAAGLVTLLHYLGDALTGRTRIPVEVHAEAAAEGESPPPPNVRVALYRIAQEAFNNIAKHARATQVAVTLHRMPERIALTIQDNGRGFDLDSVSAARLGLGIMRERAEEIGAELAVETQAGQGTRIAVTCPTDEGRRTNE